MRSHVLGTLLLLLGSVSVFYAQVPPRPPKPKPPVLSQAEMRRDAAVVISPSGKLTIREVNRSVYVEPDPSLKGPLFIWIESQAGSVLQKDEDPPGVLVLPLTGRRRYDVELTLREGQNLITVMDSEDQTEKAWLTLFADEATRPANAREREAVRNGIMLDEARNGDIRRENPPPDPADRTVRSGSGKLSAVAIHDNKQATLDVAVPDLRGPFKINVKDDSDNVVDTRTKKLVRGDAGFVETVPLKTGQNTIIVASMDSSEKAETVTLGPWTIEAPVAEQPKAFAANDFKESDNGNLSATPYP